MASVQVLNMQQNLQNGKAILPVTSLTPGIYNIRIQQNQKVEYAKFIKNQDYERCNVDVDYFPTFFIS